MKKKGKKRLFPLIFWLCVVAAALWLAFTPAHRHHTKPDVAHLHVEPLPKMEEAIGDEKAAPQPEAEQPQVAMLPIRPPPIPPKLGPKPEIAIVIDDVGLDMKDSRRAIENLPAPVTLSFMPYATRLKEQTREARDHGHELMLHMPMEPMGHDDPGPGALLVSLSMDELRQRFETALASFTGFDGVNNHMGSKFTAYPEGMEMVVDELHQRHLFFLDSRTSAKSIGAEIARQHELPTINRDVFLDDTIEAGAIRKQLEQTERIARHKGYAVAIGHPHSVTLDVLEQWIPEAEGRGFTFVAVHTLVQPVSPAADE